MALGLRYILSRRFHKFLGKGGTYTRAVGLDTETNKQLLLKHLRDNRAEGSRIGELMGVLPALSRGQIKGLLNELRTEGRAYCVGKTSAERWFSRVSNPSEKGTTHAESLT